MPEQNYTIEPPFDEELNKRLGASPAFNHTRGDSAATPCPVCADLMAALPEDTIEARLEEARAQERAAIMSALEYAEENARTIETSQGIGEAIDIVKARGNTTGEKDE